MYIERKLDLSTQYFIKDLFSDTEYIKVVDAFPASDLVVPCISVEYDSIDLSRYQLGDYEGIIIPVWYIDIFAKNKSQRDEMGFKIIHALEAGIPVYNYDEGFPPDDNPTTIGKLITDNIRMKVIKVLPQFVDKLYYRATVSFTANYESIT